MRQSPVRYHRTILFDVLTAQGRRLDWLADQIGCSQSYLSMMKGGTRPVPGWIAERAARVLHMPVEALFFDRELSHDSVSSGRDSTHVAA